MPTEANEGVRLAEDSPELVEPARREKYRREPAADSPAHEDYRYRRLLEIAHLVVGARSQPDLLRELAPRILDLTGCDFLNFSLHDPRQNCMVTNYWKRNQANEEFDAYPVDECLSGWVWTHQEAATISNVATEKRFPECMRMLRRQGVRSYSMLPMSTASRRFGALGLGRSNPEVVSVHEAEFFNRVAAMVALALENQQAHYSAEEQRQRLQNLVTISQDLSSTLDVETLAKNAIDNLRRILGHDHTVLMLLEPDGKSLTRYEVESPSWEIYQAQGNRVPLEQTIWKRAIETRSVICWNAEELR